MKRVLLNVDPNQVLAVELDLSALRRDGETFASWLLFKRVWLRVLQVNDLAKAVVTPTYLRLQREDFVQFSLLFAILLLVFFVAAISVEQHQSLAAIRNSNENGVC